MADKVLKDLEAEITASTKMLGSLSQQIENINVSINKILAGLQTEYKKTKRQEIDDLEVQENALESQYLDLRKNLFQAKHKWRVQLANILEAEAKVWIIYKLNQQRSRPTKIIFGVIGLRCFLLYN